MKTSLNEHIQNVSLAIYAMLAPFELSAFVEAVWPEYAVLAIGDGRARPTYYQVPYALDEAGTIRPDPRSQWLEVELVYQPVTPNLLSYEGGAVKRLEDTPDGHLRVGGYLVTFGSPNQTDLSGEFFTDQTNFDFVDGEKSAVYFNHRLPLKTREGGWTIVKTKIGEGVLTRDAKGILIDAILYEREQYESVLSALGWSSGTAEHLVETESIGGKTWIKSWPLKLDASLTPRPAEPRNHVIPIKAQLPRGAQQGAQEAPVTPVASSVILVL